MGKAKTASKNNPTARQAAKEVFFEGKVIIPVLYIDHDHKQKYIAAKFVDGNNFLYSDEKYLNGTKKPMHWSRVVIEEEIELFE